MDWPCQDFTQGSTIEQPSQYMYEGLTKQNRRICQHLWAKSDDCVNLDYLIIIGEGRLCLQNSNLLVAPLESHWRLQR